MVTPWYMINSLEALKHEVEHAVLSVIACRGDDSRDPTRPTDAEIADTVRQVVKDILPHAYGEILQVQECDHCERRK